MIACSLCSPFTVSGLTLRGCFTDVWVLLTYQQYLLQVTRALLRAARKLCVLAPKLCCPGICTKRLWQAAQSCVNKHCLYQEACKVHQGLLLQMQTSWSSPVWSSQCTQRQMDDTHTLPCSAQQQQNTDSKALQTPKMINMMGQGHICT